jgi:hypothetical protein
MRATGINGINGVVGHCGLALVVEIGTQLAARNAGRSLDRNHTLSRHLVPVGNRGLGDTNFACKLGDSACFVDCAR